MLDRTFRRWLDAIPARVSRRLFDPAPVDGKLLAQLETVCKDFLPVGAARAALVRNPPGHLFRGIIGAHGSVRRAPHCLVMAGPEDASAEVGYAGEAAILEATALGLGTCWVAGLFDPALASRLVELAPGERVFAVSPVGLVSSAKGLEERVLSAIARSRTRKPLEAIAPGAASWPAWVRRGVEAARLAPSAVNRQPWRFSMEGEMLVLAQDSERDTYRIPKRLDCGIAMLHFELGARGAGTAGQWRFEPSPRVASFAPERIG